MPAHRSRAMLPLALFLGGWVAAGAKSAAISQPNLPQEPSTTVAAKTTEITLPIKDGGLSLGDIVVQMTADNTISPQRAGFLKAVGRILRPEVLQALDKDLPGADYLTLGPDRICPDCPANMTLRIWRSLSLQRWNSAPRGEITGTMRTGGVPEEALARRAMVSGFINMHFAANYARSGSQWRPRYHRVPCRSLRKRNSTLGYRIRDRSRCCDGRQCRSPRHARHLRSPGQRGPHHRWRHHFVGGKRQRATPAHRR